MFHLHVFKFWNKQKGHFIFSVLLHGEHTRILGSRSEPPKLERQNDLLPECPNHLPPNQFVPYSHGAPDLGSAPPPNFGALEKSFRHSSFSAGTQLSEFLWKAAAVYLFWSQTKDNETTFVHGMSGREK